MNFSGNISVYFVFGIILESLLLLGAQNIIKEYKKLFSAIFFACIALIPESFENWPNHYGWTEHLYKYLFYYSALFTLGFRKVILPVITELTCMVSTLLLAYVYFTSEKKVDILTGLMVAGVVANLLLLSIQNVMSSNFKLLIYMWYLLMNTLLSAFFLRPILSDFSSINAYPFYSQITIGMSCLFLFTRLWAIYYLAPGRGHGAKEITRHAEVLVSKVSDYQAKTIHGMLVVIAMLIIFYLNFYFLHLSTATLISFIIVGVQFTLPVIMPKNTHS